MSEPFDWKKIKGIVAKPPRGEKLAQWKARVKRNQELYIQAVDEHNARTRPQLEQIKYLETDLHLYHSRKPASMPDPLTTEDQGKLDDEEQRGSKQGQEDEDEEEEEEEEEEKEEEKEEEAKQVHPMQETQDIDMEEENAVPPSAGTPESAVPEASTAEVQGPPAMQTPEMMQPLFEEILKGHSLLVGVTQENASMGSTRAEQLPATRAFRVRRILMSQ
jgi:HSP90 family molecular chaperone